jgi:ATP-binding protein involved in chromosome partitioning
MTEHQQPRTPSPQDRAKLEAMKRSWAQKRQIGDQLGRIRTKIGVYSGKGGVGKTTVAVNLAVALARKGHQVGLMDADIDCPNVVPVIGVQEPPESSDGKLFPPTAHGVKVLSMTFFQENPEEAIIWRGPMLHNAINQLLQTTEWGDLDFLVIDMPPGTSDVPLTVMQTLQVDGFVVVATPQELAIIDAKRSINMITKLNVKVLGLVENFSGDVFGAGAGKALANSMGLPFLGELGLRRDYREKSTPIYASSKAVQKEYDAIVERVIQQLENVESE